MKYSKKKIYYTYALLDPRKPGPFYYGHWKFSHEPFYIGKGKGNRVYRHFEINVITGKSNPHKQRKIRKIFSTGLEPIISFKREGLTEKQALDLENKLIFIIGRHNLSTGPLTNNANGGEASNTGWIVSKKQKKKLSKRVTKHFAEMSETAKIKRAKKIGNASKIVHASRSKKDKQLVGEKISLGKKAAFALMSKLEKEEYSAKLRGRKIVRTKKQLKAFKDKMSIVNKNNHKNMSEEVKAERARKTSESLKRMWANRSKE